VQGGNYFRNLMPFEQIDNVFRDRSIKMGTIGLGSRYGLNRVPDPPAISTARINSP